jgi:predicted SprT family Zn-dependent metalloprotease
MQHKTENQNHASQLTDPQKTNCEIAFFCKYQKVINWDQLCDRYDAPWNDVFIVKFIDKLNWDKLTMTLLGYVNFRKDASYTDTAWLEKYKSKINWIIFSEHGWDISEEIVLKFMCRWDWKLLINNKGVNWSFKLFKKIKHNLNGFTPTTIYLSEMMQKVTTEEDVDLDEVMKQVNSLKE